MARKLANDRVEFGLQPRADNGAWAERLLPTKRFFPPTAAVDRWLASSPLTLDGDTVRIVARKLANGRIEFGLQPRADNGAWAERLLPTKRFFPPTAAVDRWLASSPLSVTTAAPAPSSNTGGFTAISAGTWHSCALRTDGTIACWGDNDDGQSDPPTGTYIAVSTGYNHSCAVGADGAITCWGANDGGKADPPTGTYTAVSTGGGYSCAVGADGAITCWGDIGEYSRYDWIMDPPTGTYTAISAAGGRSCAVGTDGAIACWYYGDPFPIDPSPGSYTAVSAGYWHLCALRTDGTIACWGNSDGGQADPPAGTYTAISSGSSHSCAVRTDGTIACWGRNDHGQTDPPST